MLGKQLNSLQFRGEVWAGVTIVEFGDMKKESEKWLRRVRLFATVHGIL